MATSNAPQLGARIRALRERLGGISQTALAVAIGAGRATTVSQWEHDRAVPERGTLRLLGDLTNAPDAVTTWLMHNGPMPDFGPRGDAVSMAVARPSAPGMTVMTLPPPPRVTDPEAMQLAFKAFVQRVSELAVGGWSVPAHYLLEWAALLLRTAEAYRAQSRQLDFLRDTLPRMAFELDPNLRVVRYWSGRRDGSRPADVTDRQIVDVLTQLDAGALDEAVRTARLGQPAEMKFTDKSRHYVAHIEPLPDDHILLCVDRADENRRHELGVT